MSNNLICECDSITKIHEASNSQEHIELSIAIDFCASNFVFINRQGVINYLNFKAIRFFELNAQQFQKYDNQFNSHTIMGQKVAFFNQVLAKYSNLLELNLGEEYTLIEPLGDIFVQIKFSPICNHSYEIIGLSLEINDITAFVLAKQTFKKAMEKAKVGDFSQRIHVNHTSPNCIFGEIFEDINDLFDNIDDFFQNVVIGLEQFSTGNLDYVIPSDDSVIKSNTFELIKHDINYTTQKLKHLVIDVHNKSTTINETITTLASVNSEASMSIEKQFVEASQNKNELENQIYFLKTKTDEIVNNISNIALIRNNTDHIDCINNLKSTLDNMGERIYNIEEVAISMEMFFSLHLKGLQTGLNEIEQGSLGKGIKIIQREVELIIEKSTSAMTQIKSSLSKLSSDFNFHSSQSVELLLTGLNQDLTQMQNTITVFNNTLTLIESVAHQQESTFDHFLNLTKNIDHLHFTTMNSIESIILGTSEIIMLGNMLDSSVHSFNIAEINNINNQKNKSIECVSSNTDTQSVVLLWND